MTGKGLNAGDVGPTNLAYINASAACSPVLAQEGVDQHPIVQPNRVTRSHGPLITRCLSLIEVSRPIAWLSQPWLFRIWQITEGLCPGVTFPKQVTARNERNHQHSGGTAMGIVQ